MHKPTVYQTCLPTYNVFEWKDPKLGPVLVAFSFFFVFFFLFFFFFLKFYLTIIISTIKFLFQFQHVPFHTELSPLLQLCKEVQAWSVAAEICRSRNLHPQALHYNLMSLSQNKETTNTEDLQTTAAELTAYYLG